MNRYLVFCLLVTFNFNLLAASGGVEESNYSLSIGVDDNDYGVWKSLSGNAKLSVTNYIGLSIQAAHRDFDGKDNFIDSTSQSLSLDVLLRKFNLGMLTAGYTYTDYDFDTDLDTGDDSVETISLEGVLFLGDIDLSLRRARSEYDPDSKYNASSFGIYYFVNDNFRVGAMFGGMDSDASGAVLWYQPSVFGNAASLFLGIADADQDQTLSASLIYYFNKRISLKERVRRY